MAIKPTKTFYAITSHQPLTKRCYWVFPRYDSELILAGRRQEICFRLQASPSTFSSNAFNKTSRANQLCQYRNRKFLQQNIHATYLEACLFFLNLDPLFQDIRSCQNSAKRFTTVRRKLTGEPNASTAHVVALFWKNRWKADVRFINCCSQISRLVYNLCLLSIRISSGMAWLMSIRNRGGFRKGRLVG